MFMSMWRMNVLIVFILVALGTISAEKLSTETAGKQNTPVLQQRNPRYQVMPSDVMTVVFPLSPELNQETVMVQPDGFIALNNVGSVYVQGLTTPEIVESLKKAYAKVLHDPIIDVYLTSFQAPQFTVSGQVGKPGQYPLRTDTTVTEAVAVAGGFLPTAKTQVFFFHRVSTDWVEVKKLNVKELLHGKNLHEDVHLQPGDMVFVPEKFIASFRKYVPYNTGVFFNPSSALF
jgi:polysaccharide export outer membrane protein